MSERIHIVWDLIRLPRGKIFDGIKRVGEAEICTSIVVAAELRFGAAGKNSRRRTLLSRTFGTEFLGSGLNQPEDGVLLATFA